MGHLKFSHIDEVRQIDLVRFSDLSCWSLLVGATWCDLGHKSLSHAFVANCEVIGLTCTISISP